MTSYQLTLSGATPADADLFGIWAPTPSTPLSFSANRQSEPSAPVWQIALTTQDQSAEELLAARLAALQANLLNLDRVEHRLDSMGSELSFSAASEPEAELQAAMYNITAGISFSAAADEKQEKKGLTDRWRDFVTQANQLLNQYASVETVVDEQLIGRTAVGWTGDFETTLTAAANPKSAKLHQQALQLALASRTAMLRLLIVISTGAAKLALRLAVPGAQILLLPAVYKFVRDVLNESPM